MPYNEFGQPISREEQLKNEYWVATHKTQNRIGIACVFALAAIIILAGIVGVCSWIFTLITSTDTFMMVCGVSVAVLLIGMIIAALRWGKF